MMTVERLIKEDRSWNYSFEHGYKGLWCTRDDFSSDLDEFVRIEKWPKFFPFLLPFASKK